MASWFPQYQAKRMKFRQHMRGPYRIGCFGGLSRRKMAWETRALGCEVRAQAQRRRSEREKRTRQGDQGALPQEPNASSRHKATTTTTAQYRPATLITCSSSLCNNLVGVGSASSSTASSRQIESINGRIGLRQGSRGILPEAYSGLSASPSVQQFHF